MSDIDLNGIPVDAAKEYAPFARELINLFGSRILSISVTGSCITGDFVPGISDINSALVLSRIDVAELDILASLSRFKKRRIRSPLVMTEDYIRRSLDVFPIEFLDIKLFHKTIYGIDHLQDLVVEKAPLRLQCERDLKGKLINLQRGYVACEGSARQVRELLLQTLPGFYALLRSLLYLMESTKEPPAHKTEVLSRAEALLHISLEGLRGISKLREGPTLLVHRDEIVRLFHEACTITHDLSMVTDALAV